MHRDFCIITPRSLCNSILRWRIEWRSFYRIPPIVVFLWHGIVALAFPEFPCYGCAAVSDELSHAWLLDSPFELCNSTVQIYGICWMEEPWKAGIRIRCQMVWLNTGFRNRKLTIRIGRSNLCTRFPGAQFRLLAWAGLISHFVMTVRYRLFQILTTSRIH